MAKEFENEDSEEITELDLIYEASDRLDALIELLIEKKVISENEYNKKLDEVINENYESEE